LRKALKKPTNLQEKKGTQKRKEGRGIWGLESSNFSGLSKEGGVSYKLESVPGKS